MGTAWASGWADDGGGVGGAISEAPGEPVPGATGTGDVSSGARRLRVCAKVSIGARVPDSNTAAHIAPRQTPLKPRPGMAVFFNLNHGNFMLR
jgi:hypothetical protein